MTYDDIMNLANKVLEREGMLLSKEAMEELQQDASSIAARYEKVPKEEICPVKEFHVIDERADRVDCGSRIDGYSITDDNDIFLIKAEKEFPVFFLKCMNRKEWLIYENLGRNMRDIYHKTKSIIEIGFYSGRTLIISMREETIKKIKYARKFFANQKKYDLAIDHAMEMIPRIKQSQIPPCHLMSLSGGPLYLYSDLVLLYTWVKFVECDDSRAKIIVDAANVLSNLEPKYMIRGYNVLNKR